MKKFIKLYWQVLIFPILYFPYRFLNSMVIVDWLGCGCPEIDGQGNMVENSFNANDFTLIFWNVIALIVIGISIRNMRKLTKWYYRWTYILCIAAGSIFVAMRFYHSMQWL